MEVFLKLLDDLDDVRALVRAQLRPLLVTLALLVAFVVIVAGVMVLGPPELHAAP